jgi:hypothetical protein
MKQFARLFAAIDQTNSTNDKVEAMRGYFAEASPADAAWAAFFLTGRRLKRLVSGASIRDWTLAATGLDDWLLRGRSSCDDDRGTAHGRVDAVRGLVQFALVSRGHRR